MKVALKDVVSVGRSLSERVSLPPPRVTERIHPEEAKVQWDSAC